MSSRQPNSTGDTAEKVIGSAATLVIAVLALVQQLRGNYSRWWTALVMLLCTLGFALLFARWSVARFIRWRRNQPGSVSALRERAAGERKALAVCGCLLLSAGILTLAFAPQSGTSGGTGTGTPTASGNPPESAVAAAADLKALLTVPDEARSCAPAGTITQGPAMRPGFFAITPGTQVSVLLQASVQAKIVVTGIKTIVDGTRAKFSGTFKDWTNNCQGGEDEDFYLANFVGGGGEVTANSGAPASDQIPITVSSDDPVSVYIATPTSLPAAPALSWHIEITWVFDAVRHVTKVYDAKSSIIVSDR